MNGMRIGSRPIGDSESCYIITEAGSNRAGVLPLEDRLDVLARILTDDVDFFQVTLAEKERPDLFTGPFLRQR